MSIVIQRFGRIRVFTVSCIVMFLSITCFGLITYIESNTWFTTLSFIARLFQGTANVAMTVTIFSVAANFYPTKRSLMIGLLEAATGLGMMLGPLLGTVLHAIGGYNFMFYSFGSLFLILVLLFPYLLPKVLD